MGPVVDRHLETLIYVDKTFVSKGHKQASRRVKSRWSTINPFTPGLHVFQLYLLRTMAMYQIISWWLGHKVSENVVIMFWGNVVLEVGTTSLTTFIFMYVEIPHILTFPIIQFCLIWTLFFLNSFIFYQILKNNKLFQYK